MLLFKALVWGFLLFLGFFLFYGRLNTACEHTYVSAKGPALFAVCS